MLPNLFCWQYYLPQSAEADYTRIPSPAKNNSVVVIDLRENMRARERREWSRPPPLSASSSKGF